MQTRIEHWCESVGQADGRLRAANEYFVQFRFAVFKNHAARRFIPAPSAGLFNGLPTQAESHPSAAEGHVVCLSLLEHVRYDVLVPVERKEMQRSGIFDVAIGKAEIHSHIRPWSCRCPICYP